MSDAYDADLDLDDEPPEDEVDDEQETEPDEQETEPEDEEEQAAPPPRSRGDRRIETLARERAAEKARADALAAENAAFKAQIEAQQRQNQQPRETPQQLRERLSQMDPVDAAQYLIDQNKAAVDAQMAQIRWEAQESADKTSFEAFCTRNPVAAKLKDQVEQRLQALRNSGSTVSREVLLTHMLGERQLANSNRATSRARQSATTRRDQQSARPSNARGDTPAEGRTSNSTAQRNKRLESYEL